MRLYLVFVTAVCVLFLIQLRWPKKKSVDYELVIHVDFSCECPLYCKFNLRHSV